MHNWHQCFKWICMHVNKAVIQCHNCACLLKVLYIHRTLVSAIIFEQRTRQCMMTHASHTASVGSSDHSVLLQSHRTNESILDEMGLENVIIHINCAVCTVCRTKLQRSWIIWPSTPSPNNAEQYFYVVMGQFVWQLHSINTTVQQELFHQVHYTVDRNTETNNKHSALCVQFSCPHCPASSRDSL